MGILQDPEENRSRGNINAIDNAINDAIANGLPVTLSATSNGSIIASASMNPASSPVSIDSDIVTESAAVSSINAPSPPESQPKNKSKTKKPRVQCVQCGRKAVKKSDFLKCKPCAEAVNPQKVRYCSKYCQRKHWKTHKQDCCSRDNKHIM